MNGSSRRDLLSTAVVAGAALSASVAQAADQIPEPSRAPGVGGSIPSRAMSFARPKIQTFSTRRRRFRHPAQSQVFLRPTHVRQSSGGSTRQVTARERGFESDRRGEARLNAGGIRELHWHKQAEWANLSMGRRASPRSTRKAGTSSMTWGSATSGISQAGSLTRYKASVRMDANSFSSSTMATSTRTARFCSAIGSSMFRPRFWARISACRQPCSVIHPIRVTFTSSKRRSRAPWVLTSSWVRSPS